jgi:hypothetical protein
LKRYGISGGDQDEWDYHRRFRNQRRG